MEKDMRDRRKTLNLDMEEVELMMHKANCRSKETSKKMCLLRNLLIINWEIKKLLKKTRTILQI